MAFGVSERPFLPLFLLPFGRFQRLLNSITFEPVPSDFAILKIHTLPEVGGDTVWASAYEAYDRLSPAFAKHLEGLTALHDASVFKTTEAV